MKLYASILDAGIKHINEGWGKYEPLNNSIEHGPPPILAFS
jgi:hypothetical protein